MFAIDARAHERAEQIEKDMESLKEEGKDIQAGVVKLNKELVKMQDAEGKSQVR